MHSADPHETSRSSLRVLETKTEIKLKNLKTFLGAEQQKGILADDMLYGLHALYVLFLFLWENLSVFF